MADLNFIEELGIGVEPESMDTEPEIKDTEVEAEETQDEHVDSDDAISEEDTQEETEPSELSKLQEQIAGMEKRLSDKDDYIERLQKESKAKEESSEKTEEVEEVSDEDKYWEDPVAYTKKLKEEFEQKFQIQQLQIAETHYANGVEDYWKTVSQKALKEAVATDDKFAEEFNKSQEPYKTAYEYLSQKKKASAESETALREKIKAELLAEMNIKKPKEGPPSISGGTSSSTTKNNAPSDGFATVFGSY